MFSHPFFYKLIKHRCMILLITFLLYFCLEPLLYDTLAIDAYSILVFFLFVVYSPVIITLNKKFFYLITTLIFFAMCCYLLFSWTNLKTFSYLAYAFSSLTDISAISMIIFHVLSRNIKTREDLFASIITFILIAGTFGDIYYSLEQLAPGSLYFTYLKSGILHIPDGNISQMLRAHPQEQVESQVKHSLFLIRVRSIIF